jgi:flagellar L-ring protein precursor FlgH
MSQMSRIPFRERAARAAVALACAGALVGQFAGCAQLEHREPITQQPMTAVAPTPPQMQPPGSIFNPGYAGHPLFEDQRPRNVGDILTIVIAENINATKSSGTAAARNGTTTLAATAGFLPGFFNRANINGTGTNNFQGTGGANASNTFNGTITVTVTNVLPNGNLVVSGEKQMLINQGNEFVRFSGVVNPNTVSGSNTVASTQVADAKIEYSAKGYINEAETMGWLQRFFLNVAPW